MSAYEQLDDLERRFVDSYLVSVNISTAASHIGKGYIKGVELYRSERVQNAINERMELLAKEVLIRARHVVDGYKALAFYNPKLAFDDFGHPKSFQDIPDDVAYAIKKYRVGKDGEINLEFQDRRPALDSLARYLGMFEKDHEQANAGKKSLADALRESQRKKPLGPDDPTALLAELSQPSEEE